MAAGAVGISQLATGAWASACLARAVYGDIITRIRTCVIAGDAIKDMVVNAGGAFSDSIDTIQTR